MYCGQYIHSHIAHFYALAAPDFVVGPHGKPEERNILGVVARVGVEMGKEVIKHRAYAQEIQAMIGSKATHPITGLPGGMSKGITEEQRQEIIEKGKSCLEFAKVSMKVFEDVVLKNKEYLDLILSDAYQLNTYSMGLVDDNNQMNFYNGKIRIVDPQGKEFAKFEAKDYLNYIEEHVEPWSYLKFPHLKEIGWKGFVDGEGSGIYRVAPLGRINVSEGMATPLANEAYEKLVHTFGGKPIQATLAFHWARLVELIYAAERLLELAGDEELSGPNFRILPTETPNEGVGVVEAPRGTLFHHYQADERGITKKVNLIVGTTNNYAAINMSVGKAAKGLIKKGEVNQGLLNMVEMAFRAYDPCFSCATHSLPGKPPLEIKIYDSRGNLQEQICP